MARAETTIFLAIFAALAAIAVYTSFRGSPVRKQLVFRIGSVLAGLTMLVFVAIAEGMSGFLLAVGPVALIIFLNLKTVRFCLRCGRQNRNTYFFPLPKYCSACAAPLEQRKEAAV